jgi:hypothetical protein
MRRISESIRLAIERRRREDAAARLHQVVPDLDTLTFHVDESSDAGDRESSYVRYVVVERAPAMFEIACYDRYCSGVHDLTDTVLRGLKRHRRSFETRDRCNGQLRSGERCRRELHFVADATYRSN